MHSSSFEAGVKRELTTNSPILQRTGEVWLKLLSSVREELESQPRWGFRA